MPEEIQLDLQPEDAHAPALGPEAVRLWQVQLKVHPVRPSQATQVDFARPFLFFVSAATILFNLYVSPVDNKRNLFDFFLLYMSES